MSGVLLATCSLLAALVELALAARLYRRERSMRLQRLASHLFLFGALYFFAEFQLRSAESLERATWWARHMVTAYASSAFLFHFIWRWSKRRGGRRLLIGVHTSAAALAVLHPLVLPMGRPVRGALGSWQLEPVSPGLLELLCYAWFLSITAASLVTGLHYFLRLRACERRRERSILIGALLPALGILLLDIAPRWLGLQWPQLACIYSPLGALLLARGVSRGRAVALKPETFSQEIVAAMSEALLLADTQGVIRSVNPALCRLTGYSDLDLVGEPVSVLTRRPWSDAELRAVQSTLTSRAGEVLPVLLSRVPIRGDCGETLAVVCTALDYSERTRAAEALEQALDAAEVADRAKSEFLSTISHELRTPMNAIIGMSSLLEETPLTSDQRELVETTRSASETLLALISDILDYTCLESDQLALESVTFELRRVVEDSLEQAAAQAAEKDIQLSAWIDDGVPDTVRGDPTRLRQVLINLLSNAVKFTVSGEVVVTVQGEPHSSTRHWLIFSVQDTGIGIPRERLHQLFTSFSQVDSSTRRAHGSAGLGLAICHRLVSSMGGRIQAESEVGEGSTFQFTLPFELDGPQKLRLISAPSVMTDRRVLILERDGTWRRILQHQLRSWGMQPEVTGDLGHALELLEGSDEVDVVIAATELLGAQPEESAQRLGSARPLLLIGPLEGRAPAAAQLKRPVREAHLKARLKQLLIGPAARKRPARPRPAPAPRRELPQLRILLAEDHLVNQRVARNMLGRWGLRCDLAENGVEVLEALARSDYDVILMDVMMPELDGLEATRRIRERYPDRPIQIIATTANAMAGDRERCIEAGADDYISKPILTGYLEEALLRAADRLGRVAA